MPAEKWMPEVVGRGERRGGGREVEKGEYAGVSMSHANVSHRWRREGGGGAVVRLTSGQGGQVAPRGAGSRQRGAVRRSGRQSRVSHRETAGGRMAGGVRPTVAAGPTGQNGIAGQAC